MRQGLIHLYTGDGKGKTTAALGLILRAYGRGMRVVLAQFLKGRKTGELLALEKLSGSAAPAGDLRAAGTGISPSMTVLRYTRDFGFYQSASEQDKAEMNRQNNANLAEATRLANEGLCDLLILDEICAAYRSGAVDTVLTDRLILNKPPALELVLTGRGAPEHFIEAADYVTEFVKRKHPYDSGIAAREGVEF